LLHEGEWTEIKRLRLVRGVRGKPVQDHASREGFVKKAVGVVACSPVEDDDSISLITILHTSSLDMRGDHHLSGGVILKNAVGILKEFQEIEVVLLGDSEETFFLNNHQ
jgi:hypothetical protein